MLWRSAILNWSPNEPISPVEESAHPGRHPGQPVLAWPNLYSQDPAIEITAARGTEISEASLGEVAPRWKMPARPSRVSSCRRAASSWPVSRTPGDQFKAQEVIENTLSKSYRTALTQSADLPGWMRALGLKPMNLGLDLRGGIHVVIDVDMEAALDQALERYIGDIRTQLRNDKIRYQTATREGGSIQVKFSDAESRDAGEKRHWDASFAICNSRPASRAISL
jgi:preprotein translocase subunit SecD